MVGEKIYTRLLKKCVGNCTGFRGLFFGDEEFEKVYDKITIISYHVHDRIYAEQRRNGEIVGLPEDILNLEGKLMREKINRSFVFMGN